VTFSLVARPPIVTKLICFGNIQFSNTKLLKSIFIGTVKIPEREFNFKNPIVDDATLMPLIVEFSVLLKLYFTILNMEFVSSLAVEDPIPMKEQFENTRVLIS